MARDAMKLLKGDDWASCMAALETQIKASEPETAAPSLRKRYEAADKYLVDVSLFAHCRFGIKWVTTQQANGSMVFKQS